MKKILAVAVVGASLALSMSAFAADAPAGAAPKAAAKPAAAAKKTAKLVPVGDMKWSPLMPDMADGPQVAFVLGDPKSKGNVSFFLKMANNFNSGLHTHNSDYQATVVSGMFTNQLAGESDADAKQMGPGSWWWEPAKEPHLNRCVSADGCVVFVAVNGPFSFNPVKDMAKDVKGGEKGEKKDGGAMKEGAKPMASPASPK